MRPNSRAFAVAASAAVLVALIGPAAALGADPQALAVTIAGKVDDGAYPAISVPVSVVDAASGKPASTLPIAGVGVTDPSGPTTIVSTNLATGNVAGAYVLLIDISTSMIDVPGGKQTYLSTALALARGFIDGLAAGDVVKLATFGDNYVERTAWLSSTDPALGAAVGKITPSGNTSISGAIGQATEAARNRPAKFARDAVVLLTDADPNSKDKNLTLAQMKDGLHAPVYAFDVRSAPASQSLDQLLTDVAVYTGGDFAAAASLAGAQDRFASIRSAMRSTWVVSFRSDGAPDGESHEATIEIRDAAGSSGTATVTYRAAGLASETSLVVTGLRDGDELTADRAVTITTSGKQWPSSAIELFLDCDPGACTPAATAQDKALDWRLVVAPLAQGHHTFAARLTVHDQGGKQFTTSISGAFERHGTTFNIELVALVLGIALLATVATAIAARRRRPPAGPDRSPR